MPACPANRNECVTICEDREQSIIVFNNLINTYGRVFKTTSKFDS